MIAYLKLFRFPLVFTAIADSAAGYVIAARGKPDGVAVALLALASAGLYMFGMGSNDLADAGRDAGIHPDRVLPSGRITKRQGWTAVLVALALSGIAVAVMPAASPWRFGAWGCAVVLILTYNFWIKIPPVMGLIRSANFLVGFLSVVPAVAAEAPSGPSWHLLHGAVGLWLSLSLAVYGTGLTFVSLLEEGRKRRGLLLAATGMMILGAFGLPFVPLTGRFHWGWVASMPLVAWITFRALRARSPRSVMLFVRDGVAGFIVVDASFLLMDGHFIPAACVAGLLVPSILCVAWFKRLQ